METKEYVEVDGISRPVFNSKGKLIHHTEEGIINFWRWFGNSKLIDSQGRPMVVYHGTGADIERFDLNNPRLRVGKLGKGIYLTPSTQKANLFAKLRVNDGNSNVMPLYVGIKNPFEIFGEDNKPINQIDRHHLESHGYDGIILYDDNGSMHEIVVFNPTQIKSATGNNGEFNPNSSNIMSESSELLRLRQLIERLK